MEALALNPGNYRGTYKLIGGRLSLDFVNTVSWPDTARSHDWLGSVGNVVLWLNAVGLKAKDLNTPDLVSIAAARTTLTAVLRPLAHGKRPTKYAIDQLNEYLSASNSRRVIAPTTLTWTWKPSKRSVDAFGPVLLDAADIITGGRRDRLRYCPSCNWLFEDQTRNGQRRWCDMADCGSRDKAHRYYQRSK
jgi:predicted RNA-binding Zn ribbon-like protein